MQCAVTQTMDSHLAGGQHQRIVDEAGDVGRRVLQAHDRGGAAPVGDCNARTVST